VEASSSVAKVFSASSTRRPLKAVRPCVSYSMPMRLPRRSRSESRSLQFARRIGIGAILPDDDGLDIRGVAGLAQSAERVSSATSPDFLDDHALEEAEAERVVAGQPVHALLREQQHGVELCFLHPARRRFLRSSNSCASKCKAMRVSLSFRKESSQSVRTIADIWRP
jgi:hypothetical protein